MLTFPTIQNYHIKFGDELKFVSNRTVSLFLKFIIFCFRKFKISVGNASRATAIT